MAELSQILPRHWTGEVWSLDGDDYATLAWDAGNSVGKPSEAEIRAFSASVDADLADAQLTGRKDDQLYTPGEMLKAIDRVVASLEQIEARLKPAALTTPLDFSNATGTGLDGVRARIDAVKATP